LGFGHFAMIAVNQACSMKLNQTNQYHFYFIDSSKIAGWVLGIGYWVLDAGCSEAASGS